jgi:hypothetical protein
MCVSSGEAKERKNKIKRNPQDRALGQVKMGLAGQRGVQLEGRRRREVVQVGRCRGCCCRGQYQADAAL